MCVNLVLCNFIVYEVSCTHRHSPVLNSSITSISRYSSATTSPFLQPPALVSNPWHLQVFPISLIFVISRMCHKETHTVTSWDRLFFSQHNSLEIYSFKLLCVSIVGSFSLPSNISWCGCTTVCLTLRPLKDFWAVSILWLLQIKLLWTFVHRFCINISFYFSQINAQE